MITYDAPDFTRAKLFDKKECDIFLWIQLYSSTIATAIVTNKPFPHSCYQHCNTIMQHNTNTVKRFTIFPEKYFWYSLFFFSFLSSILAVSVWNKYWLHIICHCNLTGSLVQYTLSWLSDQEQPSLTNALHCYDKHEAIPISINNPK